MANKFGIRAIPTLVVLRDQTVLFAQPGLLPESALEDVIDQTRKLDMADVRRKIAEHESKHAAATAR